MFIRQDGLPSPDIGRRPPPTRRSRNATDPAHGGHGLALRCVARLCGNLLETVDAIGLNVKADNLAAIRLYERLGFEVVAQYEEWFFSR